MSQERDTKSNAFIIVSVILILVVAGIVFMTVRNQQNDTQRAAAEYTCSLAYERYSTQWQNCVDDR